MPEAKVEERSSRVHKRGARYLREAKTLGIRVRSLRTANAWTLEKAAERCDLDLKHLQKIEAGALNVTLVTLVRLAVGFRLPIEAFFIRDEGAANKPRTKRHS